MDTKHHNETAPKSEGDEPAKKPINPPLAEEFGGSGKAEPTRYGDWEVAGRCSDF